MTLFLFLVHPSEYEAAFELPVLWALDSTSGNCALSASAIAYTDWLI
jgi:hypothetical protein